MRGTLASHLCCIVAGLRACGGASDSPPGPLAKHFDDMYIARIPLEQKQSVVDDAERLVGREDGERERRGAVPGERRAAPPGAQRRVKAAKLQVDSAISAKKSAEQSADTNRINQAVKDLHTAEDLAEGRRGAREVPRRTTATTSSVYWRYTQENSTGARRSSRRRRRRSRKQNNIAPKGVDYDDFPKQVEDARQAHAVGEGPRREVASSTCCRRARRG